MTTVPYFLCEVILPSKIIVFFERVLLFLGVIYPCVLSSHQTGWCPKIYPLYGWSASEADNHSWLSSLPGCALVCKARIVRYAKALFLTVFDIQWTQLVIPHTFFFLEHLVFQSLKTCGTCLGHDFDLLLEKLIPWVIMCI